jgi:7,8-dihydroneopterin aldolase/epimerase/oxygenase
MDKIFIHDIKIETLIGAYAWERQLKQTLIFDIEYCTEANIIANNDQIETACNYNDVGLSLIQFVQQSEYQLIETLAEKTTAMLLEKFQIPWIKLRIRKTGSLHVAKEVGIEIERTSHFEK